MSNLYNQQNWMAILDQVSQAVHDTLKDVNPSLLQIQPGPGKWSVAEILDHVIRINESYYPVVSEVRTGKWKPGFFGKRLAGFWYRTIYATIVPSNTKKYPTRPVWEPSHSALPENMLQQFLTHQENFKQFLAGCGDLVNAGAVVYSPAGKFITYPIAGAFDIITQHELRHLAQIQRTLEEVKGRV